MYFMSMLAMAGSESNQAVKASLDRPLKASPLKARPLKASPLKARPLKASPLEARPLRVTISWAVVPRSEGQGSQLDATQLTPVDSSGTAVANSVLDGRDDVFLLRRSPDSGCVTSMCSPAQVTVRTP